MWFDYRPLTERSAQLSFILAYGKAFADFNEMQGYGRHVNVFAKLDVDRPEQWSSFKTMERLRGLADEVDAQYDDFWAWCFAAHVELGMKLIAKDKFKTCFVPVNAFLNERLLERVRQKKDAQDAALVRYAKSPYFHPDNYREEPLQVEYFQWLLHQLMRNPRNRSADRILKFIEDDKFPLDFFASGAYIKRLPLHKRKEKTHVGKVQGYACGM